MNISGNGQAYDFKNRQLNLNIMGNCNRFTIQECPRNNLNIMGNSNTFIIKNSNVVIRLNGNCNSVEFIRSEGEISINGNANILTKNESNIIQNIRGNQNKVNGQNYQPNPFLNNQNNFNGNFNQNLSNNQFPSNNYQQFVRIVHNFQPIQAEVGYLQQPGVERREVVVNQGLSKQQLNILSSDKHQNTIPSKCTICLENISQNNHQTFLFCFHSFHSKCIQEWLAKDSRCPICLIDVREQIKALKP